MFYPARLAATIFVVVDQHKMEIETRCWIATRLQELADKTREKSQDQSILQNLLTVDN
jgi:hypothetical protein